MYCIKCGASLRDATGQCPRCHALFDPADPTTWEQRRPLRSSAVLRVLVLIVLAVIVGFVIDAQLLPGTSGH